MLDLTGKSVAILGAGRSGQAAARLAVRCGAEVTIYDSGEITKVPEGCAKVSGATAEIGRGVISDYVITSPGIETGGPFVQSFLEGSGTLWGEIELAWRCFSGTTIAITGTNGKTTTTELVAELLRATGVTCEPCGNYGIPFAEIVLQEEPPSSVALELSSFQLETIDSFCPETIVFLNLAPDHMDRYASLEEYREAKMRIFKNANEETRIVRQKGLELGPLKGEQVTFSSAGEADWSLDGTTILKNGEAFLALEQTRLRGLHNAENLMAACAAVEGLASDQAAEALIQYCPPVHRCELVGILDGVEFLNDSKATNLHALESALRSQTRPTVLIAGGKEKGLNYEPLAELLREKAKALVTFGEIGEKLSSLFERVIQTRSVETLDEAVAAASELTSAGDTVLFSPGTSSFDQFSGYEARGDAFKEIVHRTTRQI